MRVVLLFAGNLKVRTLYEEVSLSIQTFSYCCLGHPTPWQTPIACHCLRGAINSASCLHLESKGSFRGWIMVNILALCASLVHPSDVYVTTNNVEISTSCTWQRNVRSLHIHELDEDPNVAYQHGSTSTELTTSPEDIPVTR